MRIAELVGDVMSSLQSLGQLLEEKSSDPTSVQKLLYKNEDCLLLFLVIGYEVRDRLCSPEIAHQVRDVAGGLALTCNRCTYLPAELSSSLPARARHLVVKP